METYLKNFYVKDKENGSYVLIPLEQRQMCPKCQSDNLRLNSFYYRTVYDYDPEIEESRKLRIRIRRFKCEDCNKTFNEKIEGIAPYSRVTERLKENMLEEKKHNNNSYTRISKIFNISPAVVYNVCSSSIRGK